MAITQEVNIEMLEKLPDGNFKKKNPATKASQVKFDDGTTVEELKADNAGFHNSIFRGKYLGTSVTAVQYAEISAGTFKDLYIGDYWNIDGKRWRIAAFNYYYYTGSPRLTTNHLVIVPDQPFSDQKMNDTITTEGGYTGSKMYTEGLNYAKTTINNTFSGHVVTFRAYLSNAVKDGSASGSAWFDSTVDLMNEVMVFGSVLSGKSNYGSPNIGTGKSQLPLFALNPRFINTGYSYWLRDVASGNTFATVNTSGYASYTGANNSAAVRPHFIIS